MRVTKVEAELADAEREHQDDPERAELLRRARRFKTSWIELAEALTDAKRSGHWKRWGYESFEQYAKSELHLRQETVDKLTGSFVFLQKRAPHVLERDGVRDLIPSYQAVDFLRRAESQEGAPRDAVAEIRKRVLEEGVSLPKVSREFKDTVFPIDDAQRKRRDVSGIKNVATRLRELLEETRAVPRKVAGDVTAALERLLDALGEDEEKAA